MLNSAASLVIAVACLSLMTGCSDECVIADGGLVSFEWRFNGFAPTGGEESEADGPLLECEVLGAVTEANVLAFELTCTHEGDNAGDMGFSLSPVPATLREAIDEGQQLRVTYRAGNKCPNGCNLSGGWLAIRTASDGELLVGLVDAYRDLAPAKDLLAPITLEVSESSCEPFLFDEQCAASRGHLKNLDVSVSIGTEQVELSAGETEDVAGYRVTVDHAVVGDYGGCVDDGGDASRIELLVERAG